ncbi:hypothetical protein NUU61_005472 [Penicillium alfredii]|uniref:NmrA-like domain-containing protein n=1 Tax=Penicillium alfredii TaxID=1506179 RepID=A0A9W9F9M2_9EURO|nr:uncharacterized protein NUU61_005472 [Penicillium alfredii]KAJ5096116.1 hypothetical protein NUU61_005472 [Penicillium alfredii]
MSVIAVAGGTGGVGKTIVETLVDDPTFTVIVLSRGQAKQDELFKKIQQVQIDYEDVPSMTQQLERHNIHTIISAIGLISEDSSQSQLNLIDAADKSQSTRRFIPSEYSFIQTPDLLPVDPSIQFWLDAASRLKSSSLEYTRVIPGFFMDYWGMPHVRTNLQPYTFGIDITSGTAAIPGDGNDVIGMTYTYDMAAYVVHALRLSEWPEFSVVVGDEVTYNQILHIAEEIWGKKFDVTYDTVDQVNKGDVTVPPMPNTLGYSTDDLKEVTALVSRLIINKVFELPKKDRLNTRFPDVKPITMKRFLEKAWGNHRS